MNFPGQPTVKRAVFPGRVYLLELNGSRYSVKSITDAERIHAARTNHTEADSLPIYWQVGWDVQASIAYTATKFRQRPGLIQVERRGWKKDMIEVGSTIGVRCHQLRDGSSGCLLGFITLEGAAERMFD